MFFILVLLFSFSLLIGNNLMENIIESIDVKKTSIRVVPNNYFKRRFLKDDFFIEYKNDIDLRKLDFSLLSLPFILNIISAIWISGEQYYIYSMDMTLFESLKRIKEIFKILYPKTDWQGELVPLTLVKNKTTLNTNNNEKIALLFSHGVDSLFSSLKYRHKNQVLITAWGHSDVPLDKKEMWDQLSKLIKDYAQAFGYETFFIKSNYHEFIDFNRLKKMTNEIESWRMGAIEGLGWAGMLAPVLCAKGISKLLIGSTYTWDCLFPTIAIEPIDNNIKIANIHIQHDGFDISRTKKIKYIIDFYKEQVVKPVLLVCQVLNSEIRTNCCRCDKCLRTIMNFMLNHENFRQYGFEISDLNAMKYIKDFFLKHKRIRRSKTWFFEDLQREARKKLYQFHSSYYDFFKWFISLDLKKKYDTRNVNLMQWQNMVNLYSNIPQKYLNP